MKWTIYQVYGLLVFGLSCFGCPTAEWHQIKNKCYYVKNTPASMVENMRLCSDLNATMVSIHSKDENDNLASILERNKSYWIGLRQSLPGSTIFTWLDGTPMDYTNWENGNPDELRATPWGAVIVDDLWRDDFARNSYYQICQFVKNVSVVPDAKGTIADLDKVTAAMREHNDKVYGLMRDTLTDLLYVQKDLYGRISELSVNITQNIQLLTEYVLLAKEKRP